MRKFEDTYRHKGLRKKLMDQLRDKGITDENVLNAMNNIPRHYFLDTALDNMRAFQASSNMEWLHTFVWISVEPLGALRSEDCKYIMAKIDRFNS